MKKTSYLMIATLVSVLTLDSSLRSSTVVASASHARQVAEMVEGIAKKFLETRVGIGHDEWNGLKLKKTIARKDETNATTKFLY